MLIKLDKNKDLVFKIEDEDVQKLFAIMQMMKKPEWKYLEDFEAIIREGVIEIGKECHKKKTTKDLASEMWAKLEGFDIRKSFLVNAIAQADALIKLKNEKPEA